MSGRLAGKRALVSGAGAGIGRAAALKFAVVALLDVDEPCDVRAGAQVRTAVERAVASFGGLDIIIANAGVQLAGLDDRADRLDLDVWRQTLDVNLTGIFLVCKFGIHELLAAGGGAVVCTCSPTGLFGCAPGYDAYSASKGGVAGLVRVMAADYAADGIRVNGVVPGYMDTAMTGWVTAEEHEALLATIPLGRAGRAEEVAAVMSFLASDEASYTTGAIWAADGGMTAI
jgi:NAD(P)-dependent dehydrogenase (short-subunit alcohol dehydrogenase family)